MSRKQKNAVVAFKVEEELANILNGLPNKSAFIRKAIVSSLSMACPLCKGSGVLPKGLHDHYSPLLSQIQTRTCDGCGNELDVAVDPTLPPTEENSRMEQFLHGGPYYCDDCYESAPECDDCNWHIGPDQVKKHYHQLHRGS